jgi:hypothetical protein
MVASVVQNAHTHALIVDRSHQENIIPLMLCIHIQEQLHQLLQCRQQDIQAHADSAQYDVVQHAFVLNTRNRSQLVAQNDAYPIAAAAYVAHTGNMH